MGVGAPGGAVDVPDRCREWDQMPFKGQSNPNQFYYKKSLLKKGPATETHQELQLHPQKFCPNETLLSIKHASATRLTAKKLNINILCAAQ